MAARADSQWCDGLAAHAMDRGWESIANRLPHLDPAAANAINEWLDSRAGASFRIDVQGFELQWMPPQPHCMRCGIELACGSYRFLVALDGLAALDPLLVGEPFTAMPAPLRELVVQRLLARGIAFLPAALANGIDVHATHWDGSSLPRWDCAVGFELRRLSDGAESQGMIAADSPVALQWLNRKLPVRDAPRSATQPDLFVPLRLGIGHAALTAAQLRHLEGGDVIWIQTNRPARDGVAVQLQAPGDERAWRCKARHGSLCVTGSLMPQPHSSGEAMSVEVSALDVPVSFDLGELRVALAELEKIQPGRVFELSQDVADVTINLRVAGRLIAQGTLVALGKRMGVRVARVTMERKSDV